ncbi:tRNA (cytidine(34)-2'-O)-methyltransferase [Curvivirga sp.]|uniref:tRNA (cytidine(34)-2'-O)-methyltransferase n=1 Tax=Curvivirga sp. TaxID=2856848 RepID=UPI003B5AB1E1
MSNTKLRLAMYQPDIPQNVGTMMRFAACMGMGIDIIEPCGFVWAEKKMRRAGMDYLDDVDFTKHRNWDYFVDQLPGRLLLLTTKGAVGYTDFQYQENDTLLVGRASSGVPEEVHQRADGRLLIPMQEGMRSINVALSAAMVCGEALRQTQTFPQI